MKTLAADLRVLSVAAVVAVLGGCGDEGDDSTPLDTGVDTVEDATDDAADDTDSTADDTADIEPADTADISDTIDAVGDSDAADTSDEADAAEGSDTTADAEPDVVIPDRPQIHPDGAWPRLSQWGFFTEMRAQTPNVGVIPYTVVSPLWADHAGKGRYFVLPEGERITFDGFETWQFPEGSVVIKTFFQDLDRRDPEGEYRIIETRLLVRRDGDWKSYTYVWNESETDAELVIAGRRLFIDVIDESGAAVSQEYIVPNTNQCSNCHERSDRTELLGLVTPQLNFETVIDGEAQNHLEWLEAQGVFDAELPDVSTLPALVDPASDAELDARARSWLHANCAHCHRPGGGGGRSGLILLAWEDDPAQYGVCKSPVAAGPGAGGFSYDIVPGRPEDSIMMFRILSSDPEVKMPELPNRLPDPTGVAVLEQWIDAMSPEGCE